MCSVSLLALHFNTLISWSKSNPTSQEQQGYVNRPAGRTIERDAQLLSLHSTHRCQKLPLLMVTAAAAPRADAASTTPPAPIDGWQRAREP
jgi:hypothetical protein